MYIVGWKSLHVCHVKFECVLVIWVVWARQRMFLMNLISLESDLMQWKLKPSSPTWFRYDDEILQLDLHPPTLHNGGIKFKLSRPTFPIWESGFPLVQVRTVLLIILMGLVSWKLNERKRSRKTKWIITWVNWKANANSFSITICQ